MFQFTHPVWGATEQWQRTLYMQDVSIHAPRVGCDLFRGGGNGNGQKFQFTHPVWGATFITSFFHFYYEMFQFTHPVWGATNMQQWRRQLSIVSIHAPRVGCDSVATCARQATRSFNSRTPCGVRLRIKISHTINLEFQFTHPVWGATATDFLRRWASRSFNSRTPCGVRPFGTG